MIISIFGDFVPRRRIHNFCKEERDKVIVNPMVRKSIDDADFAILNLECPFVNNDTLNPISKFGPTLKCSNDAVDFIKKMGFNVVTLANNHFFDYGQPGVINTIDTLDRNSILHVGGGKTKEDSKRMLILEKKNFRVAIVNVCEHEFSFATENHGGANAYDLIDVYNMINEAKTAADRIVVIVHGGVEHFQYPTIRMKKFYRHFIDLGADVIVNHHQHCMSGFEIYNNSPIFYGIGNFYFDSNKEMYEINNWHHGYGVSLNITNNNLDFALCPFVQCGPDNPTIAVRDYNDFMEEISKLNKVIVDDALLKLKFEKYCESRAKKTSMLFLPNRILKFLYRKKVPLLSMDKSASLGLHNYFMCESHIEVCQRIFSILNDK